MPGHEAYRTDIEAAALKSLKAAGFDVYGRKWHKLNIKVTPNGA